MTQTSLIQIESQLLLFVCTKTVPIIVGMQNELILSLVCVWKYEIFELRFYIWHSFYFDLCMDFKWKETFRDCPCSNMYYIKRNLKFRFHTNNFSNTIIIKIVIQMHFNIITTFLTPKYSYSQLFVHG
jgi:hypothetical protein